MRRYFTSFSRESSRGYFFFLLLAGALVVGVLVVVVAGMGTAGVSKQLIAGRFDNCAGILFADFFAG